ncbi:MAG TPA: GlsB/YeaQ/YmgE family stress response membrane protein [Candidatus Cybelea sp.]|nr:GlsB/YeaQ/YmgE family stress response membrane protein [Candidatus Cybelea sp.]
MLWLLWIVIFGLIVGAVARWIVPGAAPGGCITDIIVGIIGAVIGGWLWRLFAHVSPAAFQFNLPSFVCALIGAIILLWILRAVSGRRTI